MRISGGGDGGDEAGVGNEEGAHAVPVARLTLVAGDHAVDGVEDGLGAADVCGLGDGPAGMRGDGADESWRWWRGRGLGCGGCGGEDQDQG